MARLRYLQNARTGTAGTINKSTYPLQFYDDDMYIKATADGYLKIYADTSLTLEATTITINGTLVYSGTDKLHLGTSIANLTLTEGTPVFQVYTNCSSSHASTTAVPSYFCANMDTAAGVGRALEAVLTVEDVKLGSWSNAIKGKIDFETSGSGSGLLSAICAEMIMPAATMGGYGNYAPLEIEFVCPLTWAGNPQSVAFFSVNLAAGSTGDTTGHFDDIGYLMVINGLDDATTQLLYNNTLKMKVGTTTWYLPLSSAQSSYTTDQTIVSTYTGVGAIQLADGGYIQFLDNAMYIGSTTDGTLDIVSDGTVAVAGKLGVTNTLTANELGMELDIEAPLATVLHNWTAALKIDITQTSAISGTWNVTGRLLGVHALVHATGEITNVFGGFFKVDTTTALEGATDEINDLQAVVGVVKVDPGAGGTIHRGATTSMMCALKGIFDNTSTGTAEHGAATLALDFGASTTFADSYLINAWNHGDVTNTAGIYIHPFGTITTGIHLDISDLDGGTGFTTGISIGDVTNPLPLASGVYPLVIHGDVAETKTSGALCSQFVQTSVLTGFDITTTAQVFGILSQLAIEGTTTLSAGGNNTAIGAYFITSGTTTASNSICSAISATMYAGADFTVSSTGIYCGLAVTDFTHSTSVTNNDDGLVAGIFIANQGGTTLPNAIKIGGNVTNFVRFIDDSIIASVSGGTNDGWFRVNIGGYVRYIRTYDAK